MKKMYRIKRALKKILSMNLQSRLILGFLIATCLTGGIATIVGIHLISNATIDEVQRKVQQDINTAHLIYNHHMERLTNQISWIAVRSSLARTLLTGQYTQLGELSELIRRDTTAGYETYH